jgi:predicted signal transduction protein with EAL and GGDEF domain
VSGVDRAVTASIGIAVFPNDAVDRETLLRLADRALYTAKAGGRNLVCWIGDGVLADGHGAHTDVSAPADDDVPATAV